MEMIEFFNTTIMHVPIQQDTEQFLRSEDVKILPWPAQSPDLNPMGYSQGRSPSQESAEYL
jgi:hypothetical protein